MDVLTDLLDGVRARGAVFRQTLLDPPWSLRFTGDAPLTLVAAVRQRAWLRLGSGGETPLHPGDVAVVRGPAPFTVADRPATTPRPRVVLRDDLRTPAPAPPPSDLGPRRDPGPGPGPAPGASRPGGDGLLLSGAYERPGEVSERLLRALPEVLVVPDAESARPLLPLVAEEVAKDKPGQPAVLDRLLDLMLISTLRTWFDRPCTHAPMWYRALEDPVVARALWLLHDAPAHPWTVAALAERTGVSRAAFARRFAAQVGRTPMAYLTTWRVDLAADLLRSTDDTVEAIAQRVGYANGFALSSAFRRLRGHSPTAHRRARGHVRRSASDVTPEAPSFPRESAGTGPATARTAPSRPRPPPRPSAGAPPSGPAPARAGPEGLLIQQELKPTHATTQPTRHPALPPPVTPPVEPPVEPRPAPAYAGGPTPQHRPASEERPMAVGPATSETVYEPVPYWAKIPHGIWLKEATSVAVDSQDRVYVFNRGNMPVLVFDRDGDVVDMWGNDTPFAGTELFEDPYGNTMPRWRGCRFQRPHAVTVDHQDNLWLVDDIGNTVTKTDASGNTLLTIGTGRPSAFQSGVPFNRPTDVAVSPRTGDVFVTDGYANSRVHRYAANGDHLASWGEPGTDPGQFSLPHNVAMFGDDAVIVCDRENHRVQVFSVDGELRTTWPVHKAVAVCAGRGADTHVYVAEQGPPPVQTGVPNLGHRIGVYDRTGRRVTRFGAELPGEGPDQFNWLHSVAVDSEGSVYAAEVSYVEVGSKLTPPRELVSLRKWRRARG